jgi:uncharacterized protein YndB with AHSA1/START domain
MTERKQTKRDYQPGSAHGTETRTEDGRTILVVVRELGHPPEKVWSALTEPEHLLEWAPFDASRNLSQLGSTQLNMAGGPAPQPLTCDVRRADRPRVLEYTWGEDVLRWELEPTAQGTRLTLHHTLSDEKWMPQVGAGWHICLDVLEFVLAGEPIGRIVADEARAHGWERLSAEYGAALGKR